MTQHQPKFDDADRIVLEPERKAITGLGRQQWWRKEQEGTAPKRIKLGARRVGWLLSELLAWRGERVALRAAGAPETATSPPRHPRPAEAPAPAVDRMAPPARSPIASAKVLPDSRERLRRRRKAGSAP